MEGWYPGSRSYRNNNPGNLRRSKFQLGVKDGYSYFDSYEDGFNALMYDLRQKCTGNTRWELGPESTLLEFAKVWAPTFDGNKPERYAQVVSSHIGLTPASTLKDIYVMSEITQRILCLVVNKPRIGNALDLLKAWFEDNGVKTEIDRIEFDEKLEYELVDASAGKDYAAKKFKIVDHRYVELMTSKYIKGHHFVLFIYRSEGESTAVEFFQSFLGAQLCQVPVLDVSVPSHTMQFMTHELMHGWYARAWLNGTPFPDDVHSKGFTDSRPGSNYASIVKLLLPYAPQIFKEPTVDRKKVAIVEVIKKLGQWLAELIGSRKL